MSASKLVIVESPTKAKTIRKYLGSDYRVEASMGHVRDLPARATEIPAKIKKEPWARIGVNVDDGYKPVYVVPAEKKKLITELRRAVKECDELYLATDEDREGESIGWHLLELLKPKVPVHRMVFHEITPKAIAAAIASPRELNTKLVQAQETRRILDRLVGYTVSPLLWKKIKPRLSAGRVQSVAVRILVLRERERLAFVSGSYWDLSAQLEAGGHFDAKLVALDGARIATGRDFDENTGKIADGKNVLLLNEATARSLETGLTGKPFKVTNLTRKEQLRQPGPPFTTSTLQQEANRKLGYSARRTMQVAQKLYEQGLITYMRTDSVHLSDEAIAAARAKVKALYGEVNLQPTPRQYTTKAKGAQEAHEAIRPAGSEMRAPNQIKVTTDARRLYELIWKRTIATQMKPAKLAFTTATLEVADEQGRVAEFRASGREVVFPGYFHAYVEGSDNPAAQLGDKSAPLPRLTEGQEATCEQIDAKGHATKPPARYSEASLVKALEQRGVGRPSTYASIIDTIQARGYARSEGRQLIPTFIGMAVTALLEESLAKIVDIEFTATMEQQLDEIAEGRDALSFLDRFYKDEVLTGVEAGQEVDAKEVCTIRADRFGGYPVRVGRYGPYVEAKIDDEPVTVSVPPDIAPADLDAARIDELVQRKALGNAPIGQDPATDLPVYVMDGRFGPYLQLGDVDPDSDEKPRRVSLPEAYRPESVTLDLALSLLALPRTLGKHPESGADVQAGIGRYGPYVKHERVYASLTKTDNVLTVGLERGLELLAKKRKSGREPLRELGEHPELGGPLNVFEGRWGPYVKHGKVNASLPKDLSIEEVTLEDAVALIAARAEATAKKKPARKKTTKTKRTTKSKSTAKSKRTTKSKSTAK